MLRLTSKKTLPIILFMLDNTSFTQTEVSGKTGISIGRVNKIVKFLMEKGMIIKEQAKYHLIQPNRLAEVVANTYEMSQYLTFSLEMDRKKLLKLIKESKATLCLDSALEKHSKGFDATEIHAYEDPALVKQLNNIPRGNTQLIIYRRPYEIDLGSETPKALTVIDLLAAGKAEGARLLADSIWETKQ